MKQAGIFGYIGESAVPVVSIQRVLAPVGEEEIVEAVIVIVADGHGRCPAGASEAGFPGHIGESAVSIIPVQPVDGAFGRAFQAGAAQQEDVEPAVVVIVKQRAAAAHGFEDVRLAIGSPVNERRMQSGLARDIDEARMERKSGWLSARQRFDTARRYALTKSRGHWRSQ